MSDDIFDSFFDQTYKNDNDNPLKDENEASTSSEVLADDDFLQPEESDAPTPEKQSVEHDVRKAIVELLKKGTLSYEKDEKSFKVIIREEAFIRDYLETIYLDLILDEPAGIILTRSIQSMDNGDEEECPSIIKRQKSLNHLHSLVLLLLRKHYKDRIASGDSKVFIDRETINDELMKFNVASNSTTMDERNINGAMNRALDYNIVRKDKNSDNRYEILPTIRYVIDANFLESQLKAYCEIAGIDPDEDLQDDDNEPLTEDQLDLLKD